MFCIFFVNSGRFDFLYLNGVHIMSHKKYKFIYYEKHNNKQEKINKKVLTTLTLQTKNYFFTTIFLAHNPTYTIEDQILIKITEWD